MNSVQNPAYLAGLEARFAAAARHSRMVRILRIAVPAAVVLAWPAIVGVSIFNPFRMLLPKLPVDMGNLVVSGTKITMESPHLAGFSPDQRPYELWAKAAVQDLTDPDHVELQTLHAKVLMEDRSTMTLDARTGLFDSKQQLLDLRKDIFLQSSTGYEAKLSQAIVDMDKGTVTSDEHVDVKLLNGTLTADKLRIIEQRRGRAVRRQCRDEFGHGCRPSQADARGARAAPPPPKTRSPPASPPIRNDLHEDDFSRARLRAAAFALALIAPATRVAQGAVSGVPNAMQGFSQNRDQPIQIEAASLEMRDKKKEATFSGNVKVVQGDTTMTSKTLVVFYESSSAAGAAPPPPSKAQGAKAAPMQSAQPGPGGSSSIKRLEAKGNVVVTQKDQVVTGETAMFDTKANLITMLGGVVLTQCKNVLRGDRLLVDMTTGVSRVESDSGRVQGLFQPGPGQDCGPAPGVQGPPHRSLISR